MKLNERQKELLIELRDQWQRHADDCDTKFPPGHPMAQKQKSWDLERVDLLNELINENRTTRE